MTAHAAPGLRFEIARSPEPEGALRSDIAGFIGPTKRGPVDAAVRVQEWGDFERLYGGLDRGSTTSYAVRSYFENGGEIAYVVRVAALPLAAARTTWPRAGDPPMPGHVVTRAGGQTSAAFLSGSLAATALSVEASSPGAWANGAEIRIDYRREGALGQAEVDIITRVAGEPVETLRALPARHAGVLPIPGSPEVNPTHLIDLVNARSRFIRMAIDPAALAPPASAPGPSRLSWTLTLDQGAANPPDRASYLAAVDRLSLQPEPALVCLPDLYRDLPFSFDAQTPLIAQDSIAVLKSAVSWAERLHDRLILIDLPADDATAAVPLSVDRLVASVAALRSAFDRHEFRAGAVYHPPLWVRDPLGGSAAPQRLLPASGPVAGLISRLDRERGAHHTPANAALYDAVDALQTFDPIDHGLLNEAGVNVIRCIPGRGLAVWGGRTLDTDDDGRFVAHRRLAHRIVRAIHRLAQALVFDVNGPELWLTIVRGITSVLLEAWRGGALKGARPEEAFRVTCNADTNPPEQRDLGQVTCVIEFAPAVPMEFITLRVALGREGLLEVFDR